MKKQKLNYRFHNPNTAEVTADYILKVFIEANEKKVERVMQEAANKSAEEDKQDEKEIIQAYSRFIREGNQELAQMLRNVCHQ